MVRVFDIFGIKNKKRCLAWTACLAFLTIALLPCEVLAMEKEANAICPQQDIGDKQYDESSCAVDTKCAAASGCIDVAAVAGMKRVSSPFGYRWHPTATPPQWTGHKGVDYSADYGTPVYAAADGVIQERRYQYNAAKNTGWGNMILIKHDSPVGTQSRYAHLACFAPGIAVGTHVKKGQLIGYVGNTGGSTGAHLHFEILDNGQAVDPFETDKACTIDETLKAMDENAKAGGSGGNGYGNTSVNGGFAKGSVESPAATPSKDKDCYPTKFREAMSECLFCSLFLTVFQVASTIAAKSFMVLAKPVIVVVSVGFGLWLAITLLSFLSSVESKDTPTLVRKVLNQSFLVVVAVAFLSGNSVDFMALALEPIFNTGFKLAQMTMSGDFLCTETFGLEDSVDEDVVSRGLPASMGISILCTIKVVQDRLVDVLALGSTSICVAVHIKNFWIFPHWGYFFSGIGLWVGALLLLIIFPFLMLDAVLQLAVACALLPAAIGAFTFKITRGYVTKIWESFLNSMFNFVFLTIVMMILIIMIEATTGAAVNDRVKEEALNQGAWSTILSELSWTGVMFLQLIFVFLLGWAVLGEIAKFASRFASSVSGTNIGSQVGTVGASGAVNAGKKVGGAVLGKTWGAVKSGAGAVGDEVRQGYASIANARKARKLAAGEYAHKQGYSETTDEDGNKSYSYRTRGLSTLGRFKDVTSTIDKSGNMISEDQAKGKLLGSRTLKTTDMGEIKMKTAINKKGQEVSRDFVLPRGDHVLTGGGKLDAKTVTKIQNNPAISKDRADEIVLMEAMKQRMPGQMDTLHRVLDVVDQGTISRGNNGEVSMTKVDEFGDTHTFSMVVDPESKQVITTYTQTSKPDKNGVSSVKTMFSNGVVDKVVEHKIDKDKKMIKGSATTPRFAVRGGYTKNKNAMPIDYYGKLAGYMPEEKTTFAGMSETDIANMKKQYKVNRSNQQLDEFGERKETQTWMGKWGKWLENKGKAILQVDDEYIGLSEEEIEEIKAKKAKGDE